MHFTVHQDMEQKHRCNFTLLLHGVSSEPTTVFDESEYSIIIMGPDHFVD